MILVPRTWLILMAMLMATVAALWLAPAPAQGAEPATAPTPAPTATPVPLPFPAAQAQSAFYGYSFAYPSDWELVSKEGFRSGARAVVRVPVPEGQPEISLTMDAGIRAQPQVLDGWLQEIQASYESQPGGAWESTGETWNLNTTAGQVPVRVWVASFSQEDGSPIRVVGVAAASQYRRWSLYVTGSQEAIQTDEWLYRLVLSTLQVNANPL